MVTDPPYGVNYEPGWRATAKAKGRVLNDDRHLWRDAWEHFPGDVAYVWHAGSFGPDILYEFVGLGFEPRSQIIWVKTSPVLGRGHYHFQHEVCWYLVRKGGDSSWQGDRRQHTVWRADEPGITDAEILQAAMSAEADDEDGSEWDMHDQTVWEIAVVKNTTGHGTQKPIACMQRPMINNSAQGAAIYDPFLGSGTSVIAAEIIGRRVYGCELDPGYCDVIIQRYEEFTGGKAKRERGSK